MQAWDVQQPTARNSDPETSHEAAASVRNVTATHEAILEVLRDFGPETDEEIVRRYQEYAYKPRASESGIRSRRKELAVMGRLVEVGLRKLQSGRNGRVWALAKEEA